MANKKWDHVLRVELFKRVMDEFGAYSTWERPGLPNGYTVQQFETKLSEFTNILIEDTGINFSPKGGALMQLRHAITRQPNASKYVVVWVLNKAAAYDAGFITSKDFPATMALTYA